VGEVAQVLSARAFRVGAESQPRAEGFGRRPCFQVEANFSEQAQGGVWADAGDPCQVDPCQAVGGLLGVEMEVVLAGGRLGSQVLVVRALGRKFLNQVIQVGIAGGDGVMMVPVICVGLPEQEQVLGAPRAAQRFGDRRLV